MRIMTSCDGTNFCPQQALGRQWAALNYDRILGLDGTARPYTPTFRDVNIETGGGTAPLAVDSTIRVDNLNADRVDGFDANTLVRAAQASGGTVDDFDTCADTTLTTLTANAPEAGILLIWSKVAWRWDPDSSPASARAIFEDKVRVDGTVAVLGTTDTTNSDVFEISSQSTAVPVTTPSASALGAPETAAPSPMTHTPGTEVAPASSVTTQSWSREESHRVSQPSARGSSRLGWNPNPAQIPSTSKVRADPGTARPSASRRDTMALRTTPGPSAAVTALPQSSGTPARRRVRR